MISLNNFVDKIREPKSLIYILLCGGLSKNLIEAVDLLSVPPRFIHYPISNIMMIHQTYATSLFP
jgi:hypothetical protein